MSYSLVRASACRSVSAWVEFDIMGKHDLKPREKSTAVHAVMMAPQNKSKTFCRTNRSETNINRYGVSEVRQNEGLVRARQRSQWASARPRYGETPRNAFSNLQRATRAAKTPQLDASTWSEIRRRLGEVICMRRRRRRAEENGDDDRRWTQE